MTVDDILDAYHRAYKAHMNSNGGALIWDAERAGVTAIVRALRDETCGNIKSNQSAAEAWAIFEEILGDAGEKVAGGSSRDASKATEASGARCATPCASAPATDPIRDAVAMARGRVLVVDDIPMLNKLAAAMKPAADAAPAVCVWRGSKDGQLAYMGCTKRLEWTYDRRKCPSCGKPIAFTEANHG